MADMKLRKKIFKGLLNMIDKKYRIGEKTYIIMRATFNDGIIKVEMRVDSNNRFEHKTFNIKKYSKLADIQNKILEVI